MTKNSALVAFPVLIVSALWFGGKYLDRFGGGLDTLGAIMCRISAGAGLFVLIPALVLVTLPRPLDLRLLERLLIFWIALHTSADIAYESVFGYV